jgi:hypothetical protein
MGLHEIDGGVDVGAGCFAGLDEAPENVSVVVVGVAARGAAWDCGEGIADLLDRASVYRSRVGLRGAAAGSRWVWLAEFIGEDPLLYLLG